jgi:hypothetical protein
MGGDRRHWLIAAFLIAAGVTVEAIAVALYWQPCAGSMLSGSVLNGYRSEQAFTNECAAAMDQAQMFALPSAGSGWTVVGSLGAFAALLLAASWLVVLHGLRAAMPAKLIAALPVAVTIAVVVDAVVGSFGPAHTEDPAALGLAVALELTVPIALIALGLAGVRGLLLVRSAIVVMAATAPGFAHQVVEYFVAVSLSDANWDAPPGAGFFTVACGLLAAAATAVLSRQRRRAEPSARVSVAHA